MVDIHVLTADTFGSAGGETSGFAYTPHRVRGGAYSAAKI